MENFGNQNNDSGRDQGILPEIVPIEREQEIIQPSILDIEGALNIWRREEEGEDTDEGKKPTIH